MQDNDDNPSSVTLRVHPLTLETVGGEDLKRQFAAELARIHQAFIDDDQPYEGEKVKAKITVSINFTLDQRTGQVSTTSGATATLPRRKKVSQPLMMRAGGFLVEDDDEQLALYNSNPSRSYEQ